MKKVDVNCLLGNWPFRKIRMNSFDDLKRVHKQNDIDYGYVSSLNSIFYNDPFEGDLDLHETIKGSAYQHILTINPELPEFEDDIKRGIELFNIKGVRIYPGYHGYELDSNNLLNLCRVLADNKLPLFFTIRMEDERLNYLSKPNNIEIAKLKEFLVNHPENAVVLLSIRSGEVQALKDVINGRNNLLIDTSGLKEWLFVIEKLTQEVDHSKIAYGSNHPMNCLKSTLLLVEKAQVDDCVKEDIFTNNIESIYKK